MIIRLVIVAVLLIGFATGRVAYRRWKAGLHSESREHPRVPEHLVDGAEHTWVVFTTPFCATCDPVAESLRRANPSARVIKVDVTEDIELGEAFYVRSAPTVVLADGTGEVQTRLVGAEAVRRHLTSSAV